jgi:excisionase family DNA binding protein
MKRGLAGLANPLWAMQGSNLRPLPCETEQERLQRLAPGGPGSQGVGIPRVEAGAASLGVPPVAPVRSPSSTRLLPGTRRAGPAAPAITVPPERLLTVGEVAALLRVSTATIYAMCKRGELPAVRVSNSIRIVVTAIRELLVHK